MANDEIKIILTAVDKASPALKGVSKSIKGVEDQAKGSSKTLGGLASSLASLSPVSLSAAGAGVALVGFLKSSISAAAEAERVMTLTKSVIESTGGAAGYTADEIEKLALQEARLTGIDDEVVQSGMNMLLTFTNIGHDVLPIATRAVEDMAVAMAKGDSSLMDINGTAQQLGKALQDPIYGMTTLKRVGIQFSDAQKTQIQDFMKVNDLASAQGVILDELAKKYGGAAEAAGESFSGEMAKLNVEWENFKEEVGKPIITTVTLILKDVNYKRETERMVDEMIAAGYQFENVWKGSWEKTGDYIRDEYAEFTRLQEIENAALGRETEARMSNLDLVEDTNDALQTTWSTQDYINGSLYDGVSAMDAEAASAATVRGEIEKAKEASLDFVSTISGWDIQSPLEGFIQDMQWFMENGTYFQDEFKKIKLAALVSPQEATEAAQVLLAEFLIAKGESEDAEWNMDKMMAAVNQAATTGPLNAQQIMDAMAAKKYELNYEVIINGQLPTDLWRTVHYYVDIYGASAKVPGPGDDGEIPKQMGGPVYAGQRYLVGEAGPELFVPNMGGRIVPNNQITVNGGVNMNVSQGMNGKALFDEFVNELSRQTRNASTSGMLTAGRVG